MTALRLIAPLVCFVLAGAAFVASGFYLAPDYVPPPPARSKTPVTYRLVITGGAPCDGAHPCATTMP